jgi:hypothetical protein
LVSSDKNHTVAVLVNGSDSYTLLGTLPPGKGNPLRYAGFATLGKSLQRLTDHS